MSDTFRTLPNGLYVGVRPDGSMYTAQQPGFTGRHFDLSVDPSTQHSYVGAGADRRFLPLTADLQAAHDKSGLISSYEFDPTTANLQRKTNWGNVAGLAALGVIGGGAAMGALGSAGAGAGAGAAAGGVIPSTSIPVVASAALPSVSAGIGIGGASAGGSMAGFGSGVLGKVFGSQAGVAAVQGGMNLLGSKMQANATGHAADVQADAARRAEAFVEQQYANSQRDFAPYLAASQQALANMNTLASAPLQARLAAQNGSGPPLLTRGPMQMPAQALGPAGQMVTLRAPTGQTKQVPADQAAHYIALGAERVA